MTDTSPLDAPSRRAASVGWSAFALLLLLGAAWAAWAPVSGAVHASGVLRPQHERVAITVQDAGVVREWHVRDAMTVERDDLLLAIEDPDQTGQLAALAASVAAERMRLERLRLQMALPPTSSAAASLPKIAATQVGAGAEIWAQEQSLLRQGWQHQQNMQRRIIDQTSHANGRVEALNRSIISANKALELAQRERGARQGLLESGYISQAKWAEFERELQSAASRLDELRADHAQALENLSQLQGRLMQEVEAYRQDLLVQQATSLRRIEETEPQLLAARSRSRRLSVRAPIAGRVVDMQAMDVGSVVLQGQRLFDIVPEDGGLRVRALVRPEDIAHVRPGAVARMQVTAYSSRSAPALDGEVVHIAPDQSREDSSKGGHFVVWLVPRMPTPIAISAGMAVDVFIETQARSPLDYWLAPLARAWQRAAREP